MLYMGTNNAARWLPGLPQPVKKTENESEGATLPSIIPVKRIASHAALSCDRRKGVFDRHAKKRAVLKLTAWCKRLLICRLERHQIPIPTSEITAIGYLNGTISAREIIL